MHTPQAPGGERRLEQGQFSSMPAYCSMHAHVVKSWHASTGRDQVVIVYTFEQ